MSQQMITVVSLVSTAPPSFLDPGLVWSDKTGKVFDVKEETC